jgi:regulator of sirC expression with transglutaminase-like and TPR domain
MEKSQLPYLVRLLDDDTPEVREAVLRAFERFGESLDRELERLGIALSRQDAAPIQHLLERGRRVSVRNAWPGVFSVRPDKQRLETAMGMIIELQDGASAAARLPLVLDRLARDFRVGAQHADALSLARFLFRENDLRGVGQDNYLDPFNSNLIHVLEHKTGLPISLACIYILVADRLGLEVEGCNFPGHFLTIVHARQSRVLVDCYNGGRTIDQGDLASIDSRVSMKDILRLECNSNAIIARVLRNLKSAYEHVRDLDNVHLVEELLAITQSRQASTAYV